MEQVIMSQLDITLAEIFQSLAKFFGTTVEHISQNAPAWLAKYGWYTVSRDLGMNLFGGLCLAGLFLLVYFGLILVVTDDPEETFKAHKRFIVLVVAISLLIPTILSIIPCVIAPELVGLEALLQAMGGS